MTASYGERKKVQRWKIHRKHSQNWNIYSHTLLEITYFSGLNRCIVCSSFVFDNSTAILIASEQLLCSLHNNSPLIRNSSHTKRDNYLTAERSKGVAVGAKSAWEKLCTIEKLQIYMQKSNNVTSKSSKQH